MEKIEQESELRTALAKLEEGHEEADEDKEVLAGQKRKRSEADASAPRAERVRLEIKQESCVAVAESPKKNKKL